MYSGLVHLHSGLRWIVLGLLVYVIFNAYQKWQSGSGFSAKDLKMNKYAVLATHIQILIGLVLYFISPRVIHSAEMMKDSILRFFAVEHAVMMIIGAILITIGSARGKKRSGATGAKSAFWLFLIGLLVILSRIPWPWQAFGAGWG